LFLLIPCSASQYLSSIGDKVLAPCLSEYHMLNRLSQIHGYGRDTFVRLLTALLVNNTNIRAIKIGTKTMYRRTEIDALMLENSHLG